MARLHTNVLHWGNKYDGPNTYKMGREGALDDALWDEDELVDYPKPSRKVRPKKKPGCSGNDGKSHVYVWVDYDPFWTTLNEYEVKICCGCGKRAPRGGFRTKTELAG